VAAVEICQRDDDVQGDGWLGYERLMVVKMVVMGVNM
jgi:hypothetical protein